MFIAKEQSLWEKINKNNYDSKSLWKCIKKIDSKQTKTHDIEK